MAKKTLSETLNSAVPNSKAAISAGNNFDKVKTLVSNLNKHYKSEVIKHGTSIPYIRKVKWGEPSYDLVSDGGAPISRIIELLGQEHSGKTRGALALMAKFQKYCFNCSHDDALDVVWEQDKDGFPKVKSISCKHCNSPRTSIQAFLDIEGCIAEDQEIFDPVSGFFGTVGEYNKEVNKNVISYEDTKLKIVTPKQYFDSGILDTMQIKTKTTSLKATPNHPIKCYREGKELWLRMDEIKIGDHIGRPRRISIDPLPTSLTPDDAELLGMLIGDGGMSNLNRASLTFTNIDSTIWERLEKLLLKWNYSCKRHDNRHARLTLIKDKGVKYDKGRMSPLKEHLRDLTLLGKKADTKYIPSELLMADVPIISALLRGLWMTDGTVNSFRASAIYNTTSKKLAVQIKWLLHRLGIVAGITDIDDEVDTHNIWYAVTINSYKQLKDFQSCVHLYSYKGEQLDYWASQRPKRLVQSNYLPDYHQGNNKFNHSDIWWDEVTEIVQNTGKIRCFDATVEKSESWTVNDVIVHNTTDPVFMQYLGVDVMGVLYSKPDRPSTAVDTVDALLRMPDIGLIVMDSVGGMGADKEVDNAIADDKMNQNALFLNKACRKWQMSMNANTNSDPLSATTLLVVNQSYSSIGMFSYEIAQGGRGLRHGKGISIKSRIEEKKYDERNNILGVHVALTNEKNKTGIPYRKTSFFLNLDKSNPIGYCRPDVVSQLVEIAINEGYIIQKGGWYYLEDGGKGIQGRDTLIQIIRDDVTLQDKLSNQIAGKNE